MLISTCWRTLVSLCVHTRVTFKPTEQDQNRLAIKFRVDNFVSISFRMCLGVGCVRKRKSRTFYDDSLFVGL